jgi:hypothetical protein
MVNGPCSAWDEEGWIEVGVEREVGKMQKKAARTVNCPCREASDATRGKTRLPDQEPCSTHPVLLPLLNQMQLLAVRKHFFYRFGSHLASTTSTNCLKCTRNSRNAQVFFISEPGSIS